MNTSILGFGNLLRAIYLLRYQAHHFSGIDDLVFLIKLADFYRALPVVSLMVEASLFPGCRIVGGMADNHLRILNLSHQLRAPKLFREAFILTIGKAYQDLEGVLLGLDGRLYGLIYKYLAKLSGDVSDACHELHRLVELGDVEHCSKPIQMIAPAIKSASKSLTSKSGRAQQPQFYHSLLETSYKPTEAQWANLQKLPKWYRPETPAATEAAVKSIINNLVGPLMRNNMYYQLDGRVGRNLDCFVFTKLLDQDLPWDPEETDW